MQLHVVFAVSVLLIWLSDLNKDLAELVQKLGLATAAEQLQMSGQGLDTAVKQVQAFRQGPVTAAGVDTIEQVTVDTVMLDAETRSVCSLQVRSW